MNRSSSSFNIPGYSHNAVLQLIVASGSGFIMYHLVRVTLIVFGFKEFEAISTLAPYVGLGSLLHFPSHFWTLLTYGWVHTGFWEWFSNMIWLYCFGNALQMLVGYREVLPVYIYGLLGGGIFVLLSPLIPIDYLQPSFIVLTGQAGVMALLAALFAISPGFRFYLGDNLGIPLWLVGSIYLVLTLATHNSGPMIALSVGGMLTGMICTSLLKRGTAPAGWFYRLYDRANALTTPGSNDERAGSRRNSVLSQLKGHDLNQKRIDEILDKINQRGVQSLTREERELLAQAGKEGK